AVVQILARMDFVADVDAGIIKSIEDRGPAAGELVEGFFNEAGRALRPRIDIGPGQRTREGGMGLEAEVLRGFGSVLQGLDGPFLTCLGVAMQLGGRKAIECGVVSRVNGDEL